MPPKGRPKKNMEVEPTPRVIVPDEPARLTRRNSSSASRVVISESQDFANDFNQRLNVNDEAVVVPDEPVLPVMRQLSNASVSELPITNQTIQLDGFAIYKQGHLFVPVNGFIASDPVNPAHKETVRKTLRSLKKKLTETGTRYSQFKTTATISFSHSLTMIGGVDANFKTKKILSKAEEGKYCDQKKEYVQTFREGRKVRDAKDKKRTLYGRDESDESDDDAPAARTKGLARKNSNDRPAKRSRSPK